MPERTGLILNRKWILANGAIVQVKVWRLTETTKERPHGLKYSLFYGRPGERIIGYDNEAGKGDHRHYRDREEPYVFRSLEQMLADFERDIHREIGDERS